jgi:hypothetical protein
MINKFLKQYPKLINIPYGTTVKIIKPFSHLHKNDDIFHILYKDDSCNTYVANIISCSITMYAPYLPLSEYIGIPMTQNIGLPYENFVIVE